MARLRDVSTTASVAVAAVCLIVSCGNDEGDDIGPSPRPPAATTPTAPPTATVPPDLATATAEVERNWERFFNPRTPLAERVALVKDGKQMEAMVKAFAAHPRYGQVKAVVEEVVFATPTTADVSYTLYLRGRPLPVALGNAVLQDGIWKLSAPTFCALAQVAGDIPLAARCR
jgi:hypothetical protein